MAESTLSLQYKDLAGEVGLFLGFGRGTPFGDPAWSDQQQAAIDSCVRSGLRQFYFPPPIEGDVSSYDWSFLKPVVSMGFAQGATTIPLPDDFGGLEGRITISSPRGVTWWPVEETGIGDIYLRENQYPNMTGRPLVFCLEWLRPTTATQGQRGQLHLFPKADQAYTLQFAYYVAADYLNEAFPFHMGGMAHAETVLESCLAIAEQRLDDSSSVHSRKFQERLIASVNLDRRMKPQKLGYNRDNSDLRDRHYGSRPRAYDNLVTVNGAQY